MSTPLSSSDQDKIQSVESTLNEYIQQSQTGKLNFNDITSLQQQLAQLAKNPNIPDSVRQNLQAALNELKQVKSGSASNLANLTFAQRQLNEVLGSSGGEGLEGAGGDKVEGGSLGGGGSEE